VERWLVVGGGAAGCVVAAGLSDDPDRSVLLVEAGIDHAVESGPNDVGPFLGDAARITSYTVARRRDQSPVDYPQGCGWGGSSLINGTVVTDPGSAPDWLPLEPPWAHGAVATALMAADGAARPVALVRRGRVRRTAADLFLRPVLERSNLEVRTQARVATLRFDGRRVVGVTLEGGGSIDADHVVLCAGTIGTTTILLRSGVDTPGVGEWVRDHPAFALTLRLFDFAIDDSCPTISTAATHPGHQVIALDHLPTDRRYGALMVGLTRPQSVGRIELDRAGRPVIELCQLDHAADREALVEAVATTISRLDDPAWHSVVAEVYVDADGTPLGRVAHDHLDTWVVEHATGHHHLASGCREGVVTDGGVVRGYDGLYVADSSALPDVPPVDPYVAVLRQARRFVTAWMARH
jgi:choline dehydrogenase